MLTKIRATTFLLLSIVLMTPRFNHAKVNENGDFQIWTVDGIFVEIDPHISWLVATELRWGDKAKILYYQYAETAFFFHPKQWLWIAPSYRQEWNYRKHTDKYWSTIFSPYVNVMFAQVSNQWSYSWRNFLMYRCIRGSLPSEFRYRTRLQVIFPKVNYFPIWIYVSEEAFFDQRVGFSQNRLIAGAQYTRKDRFRTAIEYMYRNLKENSWSYQNILNIRIHLEF